MANRDELKRLEADLAASEELRKRLDEATRRIAEAGEVASDGELMVAAAAEFGYEISIADLERASAELEELDDAELDKVAGGFSMGGEDEYGHDLDCLTLWHCAVVTLHTECKDRGAFCWKDYKCYISDNWGLAR